MSQDQTKPASTVGSIIKNLREHHHPPMTQMQLAAALGVAANTVSRWETGVYEPSMADLSYLASYFSTSVSTFFPQNSIEETYYGTPQVDLSERSISATDARRFREALMNACDTVGVHPQRGHIEGVDTKLWCSHRAYRRLETVYLILGIPMDDMIHFQPVPDEAQDGNVHEIEARGEHVPGQRKVIMRVIL